jgi:integrase|tara:strand:- start:2040 stop:3647 length:1608 start_codon:yes stop_codon:yes gene_type:complete
MLKGKTMEEKNINNAQQTASLSASRSHTGGRKVVVKTGTTFNFTKANIKNLKYQGKKERPDKRFDSGCDGLCLFIFPSGVKTFYAVVNKMMWNKKKQRSEKNAIYKKLFLYNPDSTDQGLKAARSKVAAKIKEILQPRLNVKNQKTFGELAKSFMESGMDNYRLADKTEKHEYKQSTIDKYKKLIRTYILIKPHKKSMTVAQKNRFNVIANRLCDVINYKDVVSNKPLKDYALQEITDWHIEVVQHRLKTTKTTANDVIKIISIIFSWAKKSKRFTGTNPCSSIIKFPERKIKSKLTDDDVEKIMNHCKGKAFDYDPFFCCYVALILLLGKRPVELFGLRWKQPYNQKDIDDCSGWLESNWKKIKYLYLRDTKNRKPERVFIDDDSVAFLERLESARFTNRNSWSIKSPFLFPQYRATVEGKYKHATQNSFRKRLIKLNEKLGLTVQFKDEKTGKIRKRLGYNFKLGRKTFGSKIAEKEGLEIASRKLNHSSTKVTKEHYIVPVDTQLEIENVYQKKIKKEDRITGVIVNRKEVK